MLKIIYNILYPFNNEKLWILNTSLFSAMNLEFDLCISCINMSVWYEDFYSKISGKMEYQ